MFMIKAVLAGFFGLGLILAMSTGNRDMKLTEPENYNEIYKRAYNRGSGTLENYPYVVSIHNKRSGDRHICGGVLLSENAVLTSGYCISDHASGSIADAKYISVVVYTKNGKKHESNLFKVKQVFRHEKYTYNSNIENDIGIIKLDKKIGDHFIKINGIEFAKIHNRKINGNTNTVFLGWGQNPNYKFIRLSISNSVMCSLSEREKSRDYTKDNDRIIHSNVNRLEMYKGDSGGPLVLATEMSQHNRVRNSIIGIKSSSDAHVEEKYNCGNNKRTDYFTNIFSHIDWIQQKSGISLDKLEYYSSNSGGFYFPQVTDDDE
ncbi:Complement factor D [Smittium culicis]|uniref:Complement factor D n=1 Tax=Smittium culicis TaxID=133412 RepID=A0A1R1YTP4_9FUNG|nr:Complement factor D [Smittium culicis]